MKLGPMNMHKFIPNKCTLVTLAAAAVVVMVTLALVFAGLALF